MSEAWRRENRAFASPAAKEPERLQVAADVAAFLASGGKIERVPAGVTGNSPLGHPKRKVRKRPSISLKGSKKGGVWS